ncbi:ClpB protein [Mesobacillus boroniphilus JCM 21738]|uniref:ClpB protein n=1 Tax=Mesobacillus boroniphilus JCM 21738 TaxID=1294265 RepID=W4RPE0_9BACI|nr:ClpB protein [Mesobacillus boroniphilus JCM 21738]
MLTGLGLNLDNVKEALNLTLSKKPQVSGSGVEQGKLYISTTLQKVLALAEKEMKQFEDDYLSVEHVLLAAIEIPGSESGGA